jgi:exodeoxyribonuclease V gamma subunit
VPVPAGIVVYTSNRLEELLHALAEELRQAPLAPLSTETIVVPGQGLARWVKQQLAEQHGIAAGLRLPFPGAFLQELAVAAAPGPDLFGKDVLRWRLWRLLGDASLQAALGPAAAYCADDPDGRKRYQLCERLAACFDDYQLYREDLLRRSAAGDDLRDCGPHGPWQAQLWRLLRRDAGLADARPAKTRSSRRATDPTPLLFPELAAPAIPPSTPAAGHRLAMLRELLADPARARRVLPERLAVFGAGTLPPAFLYLLRHIGAHVPVRLYVPQPTPEYAGDLRPRSSAGGNQLLARLGTEAREFADQLVDLADGDGGTVVEHVELADVTPNEPDPKATLLSCLQRDIAAVVDRGGADAGMRAERRELAPGDHSLLVHDCHSPQRELEVVRDQILAAFAADAHLEPHEILVLVPDIDRYAPYAQAVFGPVAEYLPFHVADRNPAAELPLCASLFAVLQLASERLHVFDVLHLLEEPAVQRRFSLFAADLPLLRNRCERAGIRWGLDGEWRQRHFQVPAFDDNAWLQGLDRLLLGVATGPVDDLVAGVMPVADTTDGREDLLVRFVHFARTLFACLQPLQRPHPLGEWADLVDGLLATLYEPGTGDDGTAVEQIQRATALLRSLAGHAGPREPIAPIVLRDWLRSALQQQTGSRGFLAGAVTVAAMLPMRTVPVRHLFLCGLDDQSFPRRDQPAPFDLVAANRRPGDRSLRLDDRQMFLDALLAARERLHITFVGRSQKDDSPCAPSVVLDELLDVIDRGFSTPGTGPARQAIVVRHPLQPWSRHYRTGEDPRLFTFSTAERRLHAPTIADEPVWCSSPIPSTTETKPNDLQLDRLREFWHHPCRFFLRHTMRIRLRTDDDRDRETESFTVDALDRWQLQDEAVRRTQRAAPPPADALALARASGMLPVGGHGAAAFADLDRETTAFLHSLQQFGPRRSAPLRVELPAGRIHGEIEGLCETALVLARIANLKAKDRLRGWIHHLLLSVARSQGADLPARTCIVAKNKRVELAPVAPDDAKGHLADLLAGLAAGTLAPLPFFEHSSYAYAKARNNRKSPEEALRAARREWTPNPYDKFPQSDLADADVALCCRGEDPLAGDAFAAWAERIWLPYLGYAREGADE